MKCINRRFNRYYTLLILISILGSFLCGCGRVVYEMPYDAYSINNSYTLRTSGEAGKAETFAADLCIANNNYNESAADISQASAAALFSINTKETLYAKNVHQQLYPASITKVLTALVALKKGNRDDVLTATENVVITESGAQLAGLSPGDYMTMDQALRILLMYSANDVAVMIAEHYGQTVENFCNMMNEEALRIGATNCHFSNPNGLTDEALYVTAYDLYLIFSEACKYGLFKEIINMQSYSTVYHDRNGNEKTFEKNSTNWFINGDATAPTGITVIGGKTGTTTAAGHCLILLTSDTSGREYISVILQASERQILYDEMIDLLNVIHK